MHVYLFYVKSYYSIKPIKYNLNNLIKYSKKIEKSGYK